MCLKIFNLDTLCIESKKLSNDNFENKRDFLKKTKSNESIQNDRSIADIEKRLSRVSIFNEYSRKFKNSTQFYKFC